MFGLQCRAHRTAENCQADVNVVEMTVFGSHLCRPVKCLWHMSYGKMRVYLHSYDFIYKKYKIVGESFGNVNNMGNGNGGQMQMSDNAGTWNPILSMGLGQNVYWRVINPGL
jgi:hypothetical protein